MSEITTKLLSQLPQMLDQESASKAAVLLSCAGTRMVDGAPTHEEVKDLLPTLKARLTNSTRTGKRIFGLNQLIARLEQMDSSTMVVGYGFISPNAAGNVYLTGEQGEAIGAAIVDR